MSRIKILIVEDETIIAMNLKETLVELGYDPCGVTNNKCKTMKWLEKGVVPDLILMDIYLKGPTTGIDLAKELKDIIPNTPVVFLSANSEVKTIKEASEALAYGYILKPYKKSHLHASIEVALEKANADKNIKKELDEVENVNKTLNHKLETDKKKNSRTIRLKYGYLFDKEKEILYYGDEVVKLTKKEIDIIKELCYSPGHYISQDQIEYAIWKDEPAGYAAFRSVLNRLRNKLAKDIIKTQKGIGYKIETS